MHLTYLYISLPFLHDYDVKMPNFTLKEDAIKRRRNFIVFLNLNTVLRNSTPGGFTYFWQSMWVGIIAIKTKRTQIYFWSNVFAAGASSDSKVPITEIWREDFIAPQYWNQGRKALSKRGQFLYQDLLVHQTATLETKKELEPKWAPQLFVGE